VRSRSGAAAAHPPAERPASHREAGKLFLTGPGERVACPLEVIAEADGSHPAPMETLTEILE
jgi:hypothetical protein